MRTILDTGTLLYTPYSQRRMRERQITAGQVEHVLRAGLVEPAEWEGGEWRYRVRMPERGVGERYVVVAFVSDTALLVVTVWR
jgi:hypothetical protein